MRMVGLLPDHVSYCPRNAGAGAGDSVSGPGPRADYALKSHLSRMKRWLRF